jgi:hypothetical protein
VSTARLFHKLMHICVENCFQDSATLSVASKDFFCDRMTILPE